MNDMMDKTFEKEVQSRVLNWMIQIIAMNEKEDTSKVTAILQMMKAENVTQDKKSILCLAWRQVFDVVITSREDPQTELQFEDILGELQILDYIPEINVEESRRAIVGRCFAYMLEESSGKRDLVKRQTCQQLASAVREFWNFSEGYVLPREFSQYIMNKDMAEGNPLEDLQKLFEVYTRENLERVLSKVLMESKRILKPDFTQLLKEVKSNPCKEVKALLNLPRKTFGDKSTKERYADDPKYYHGIKLISVKSAIDMALKDPNYNIPTVVPKRFRQKAEEAFQIVQKKRRVTNYYNL